MIQPRIDALCASIADSPLSTRQPPHAYDKQRQQHLQSLAYVWTGCTHLYLALIHRAEAYDKAYGPSPASDWQTLEDFATIIGMGPIKRAYPPVPNQRQMTLL